ncbi:MAG: DNA mismatch repair endonuclease MutL [Candidatus Hydrogenedentes bacterium]|nr:DNA mismatch repair endonuclease MutL [Candidatus Hydrogenedentota bacterium]
MSTAIDIAPVRILPDDIANKIAAGEVVERPSSVVKELVENAIDAKATRIQVRVVAAGRRLVEVIDNGHGMSEQNALLAIERHATSKIRTAEDLESVLTMGFRGEALASIAAVSRFELVTRRAKDEAGTRIRIDGGILRDVSQIGAQTGTRITVNRLYFNTPVRAKFLKGITTELGHCIDAVQRHALSQLGVGFQFIHNDKVLLDIPEHAALRERVALIWGLTFANDMVEVEGEQAGFTVRGIVGKPGLTRAQRSHQFFFMNRRPVVNRSLQYGFEDGFRGLVTIGRHPVGILMIETHPRFVDVNIHPAKREIRFRDERAARDAVRDILRRSLAVMAPRPLPPAREMIPAQFELVAPDPIVEEIEEDEIQQTLEELEIQEASTPEQPRPPMRPVPMTPPPVHRAEQPLQRPVVAAPFAETRPEPAPLPARPVQQEILPGIQRPTEQVIPEALYEAIGELEEAPLQVFDTYLLVPGEDRLLIIDQHALHERLNYDNLLQELEDNTYESQQLAVPIVFEVAPSQVRLVETNLKVFAQIGIEIEPFGGTSFQITAICHLYEDDKVRDLVYSVLDELQQGDLFDRGNFLADVLRLATRACKASVRAGDRLSPAERKGLLEGFRQLRPPYTCPHGRPIIVELTQHQMEKSFRRIQ